MSDESVRTSGDLIRWLKMLALPTWAKALLAILMALVLLCALGLLIWGVLNHRVEVVSSAVTMLTVGLPISLLVVAMVFGDGGAQKLQKLTRLVLEKEIPAALNENLAACSGYAAYRSCQVQAQYHGCIADYVLSVAMPSQAVSRELRFKLELNVRKANLVLWLPTDRLVPDGNGGHPYESCFFGALQEGYIRNESLVTSAESTMSGVVFIKALSEDFLLNPAERLYFAQDLAFFVRGVLSVELRDA